MNKYTYWIKTITKCPVCGSESTNWAHVVTEHKEKAYDRILIREEYCCDCERNFKGH